MKHKRKGDIDYILLLRALTQFQTSTTSSCVETFKGKILAEKVTHCYLNLVWGAGSQYSDWTKLFQLVFQCNPFLMNLLELLLELAVQTGQHCICLFIFADSSLNSLLLFGRLLLDCWMGFHGCYRSWPAYSGRRLLIFCSLIFRSEFPTDGL